MDPTTRTELEASIRHWEENVASALDGKGADTDVGACALCSKFFHKDCKGCPVREKTGKSKCAGSPYDWFTTSEFRSIGIEYSRYQYRYLIAHHATLELEFLRSLLPDPTKVEVHVAEGPLGPLYTIIGPTAEAVNGEIYNIGANSDVPLNFSLPIRMGDGHWASIGRKLP